MSFRPPQGSLSNTVMYIQRLLNYTKLKLDHTKLQKTKTEQNYNLFDYTQKTINLKVNPKLNKY